MSLQAAWEASKLSVTSHCAENNGSKQVQPSLCSVHGKIHKAVGEGFFQARSRGWLRLGTAHWPPSPGSEAATSWDCSHLRERQTGLDTCWVDARTPLGP